MSTKHIDKIEQNLTMSRALLGIVVGKLLPGTQRIDIDDSDAATLLWQVEANLDSLEEAANQLWEQTKAQEVKA